LLVKRGFRGPIYVHEAAGDLVAILLSDAAHLETRDAEYQSRKTGRNIKPLFTVEDGAMVMRQLQGRKYRQRFQVVPGIEVCFRDAGHILGSCAVEVFASENGRERKLVFSGDLGQYDTPILKDPECIDSADYVLMESTYGNRRHRDRADTAREMGEILTAVRVGKGNVMIPAFAIGRTQEVLYMLGKHYEEWQLDRFQIFLDSPMAIEVSKVYWDHHHLYDEEATRLRQEKGGMPLLPNLKLSSSTEDSMAINRIRSGAIIIAGSGMCNGGRIVHHLKHNLPHQHNHVIIVGYQAYGSTGRRLVDRETSVRIHGEDVPVRAQVHTVGGLSAHGDQDDLARWYECMQNRPPVWLVHGERESQQAFQQYLLERNGAVVHLPDPGERLEL
jgi:metallo-beta-lactamase family protein